MEYPHLMVVSLEYEATKWCLTVWPDVISGAEFQGISFVLSQEQLPTLISTSTALQCGLEFSWFSIHFLTDSHLTLCTLCTYLFGFGLEWSSAWLAKASNISKQVLENAQSLANALHEIFIWKCNLEAPGCWWRCPPLGPFSPIAPHIVLPFVPCFVSCLPSQWRPLSPVFLCSLSRNLAELSAPLVIFVFRFGSPLYIGLLSRWSKLFWSFLICLPNYLPHCCLALGGLGWRIWALMHLSPYLSLYCHLPLTVLACLPQCRPACLLFSLLLGGLGWRGSLSFVSHPYYLHSPTSPYLCQGPKSINKLIVICLQVFALGIKLMFWLGAKMEKWW